MNDTKNTEISVSVDLATKLAESSERLKKLQAYEAPAVIIEQEKTIFAELQDAIKKHPLAEELYFQARVRERYYEARKLFLQSETVIGKLTEVLTCHIADFPKDIVDEKLRTLLNDEEMVETLNRVSNGKQSGITLQDLLQILDLLLIDLLFLKKDIPPIPPQFVLNNPETNKDS
jgi:hypothetical protein